MQSSKNGNGTVGADFIAAFGQSNVGDTSPNILGAFCQDTGEGLDIPFILTPPSSASSQFAADFVFQGTPLPVYTVP